MYKKTLENTPKVRFNIHPQVQKLNDMPQVAQRSEEWFLSRKTRITASELGTVLGVNPYSSRNCYWRDKLAVLKNQPDKERKSSWISEWGVRYEPVVQNMIRNRFKNYFLEQETDPSFQPETLFEYGMVCHPNIPFLGASPDGILFDGTMVEIKCPPTRQIESFEVVPYYYSQMQLQMECCELDRVEFIECKFYEYRSKKSFLIDSLKYLQNQSLQCDGKEDKSLQCDGKEDFLFISAEDKPKGAIASVSGQYIYFEPKKDGDFESWYKLYSETPDCVVYLWKLETYSSKMITRNQEYIQNMIEESTIFWESLVSAVKSNIDSCPLPSPRTYLFENFVFDNILVVYKKKGETETMKMQEGDCADNLSSGVSTSAKRKFSFNL